MRPLAIVGSVAVLACGSSKPAAPPPPGEPLVVSGVIPADGAAAVARNAAVAVKFNRPATNVTAGCGGTVRLSDDAFASCAAGSFSASDGGATWTFTPATPLHASATYKLRVTTGVHDASGAALGAPFDSGGFTTAAALTATLAPSGTVALRPQITVTFSRAVTAASVTSIESGTACGGTVRLSAGGACVAMTHALSGNVATFTPAQDLAPATAYTVTVTTGVLDSDGVPLDAATGAFATTSGLAVTGFDLQHFSIRWLLPSGAAESRVYLRPAGGSYSSYTSIAAPAAATTLGPLTPGATFDVKVTTVTAGVESAGGELTGIATGLTGADSDWLPAQLATGEAGGLFRFTWSGSDFFAAYSNGAGDAGLQPASADALWIAFDTDPDADVTGETRTATGPNGEVIWPFRADFVAELKTTGTRLRTASSGTWAPLSATAKLGARISEIGLARSAIGSPAKLRVAFAAVATHTGGAAPAATFDVAPAHGTGNAIVTLGQLASLTASYPALDPAAVAAPVDAPWLVKFTVAKTGSTGVLQIAGSLSPLSTDLSRSAYRLHQADIGLWDGRFNFGGEAGELFFEFANDGSPEPLFVAGRDRVYTLSGDSDTLPALSWNQAYGAGGSFTVVFDCKSGCESATSLRETGASAPLAQPFTGAASVSFTARDFVTAPLAFKAFFGATGEAGSDHLLDDDVINTRTLVWTAGDGTTF